MSREALSTNQLHRAIILRIEMADPQTQSRLRRLDLTDSDAGRAIKAELHALHDKLIKWAAGVRLDTDPPMPSALRDSRFRDNWRPLLSIADSLGSDWGKKAREAAIAFCAGHSHEDVKILLLRDILAVFTELSVDRIRSQFLLDRLLAKDDAHFPWTLWTGKNGDQPAHPLTTRGIADMLKDFRTADGVPIRPRSIWPAGASREPGLSGKGYLRAQFVEAWRRYCDYSESVTLSSADRNADRDAAS